MRLQTPFLAFRWRDFGPVDENTLVQYAAYLERIDLSFSLSTFTWIALVCRLDLCDHFFWSTLSPTPFIPQNCLCVIFAVLGLGALNIK